MIRNPIMRPDQTSPAKLIRRSRSSIGGLASDGREMPIIVPAMIANTITRIMYPIMYFRFGGAHAPNSADC